MDKNRKLLMKYKEVIDTLDFSEDDDSDSAVNKLMDDGAAHPETELAKKPLPLGSLLTSEECKAIGYCDLSGCSDGEPVISVDGVEVGVSGSMLRQKNAPEMLDSDWKVVGKKNRSSHLSAVVGVKRKVVPMSLKTKANVQPASKRSKKMRSLFLGNSINLDECMSDDVGAHGVRDRSAGSHSDKDAVVQQHIQQEQGQVQAAKVPTLFLPKVAQIQPLLEELGSFPCANSFTTKCSQGDGVRVLCKNLDT
ncbi:GH25244 [Drosophila grimshawi]|uniref:GH25244 n=1 Tax=Drosophila grimshawi TaxID=7222 RepID=B4K1V8_DROGR|nr:GH25244 [Drosophila grimshawi]